MTETEHVTHGDDLLDAGGISELVEIGVAGNLERVFDAKLAVCAFFFSYPALHVFVAVLNAAVAAEGFLPQTGAHSGEGDGNLVGRTGRVGADGAVHEGIGLVLVDLCPLRGGNGWDEHIRIIRGDGCHGEDIAIPGIDDHGGASTDDAQGLLGDVLDFRINRQIGVVALHGFAAADLPLDDAFGISLQDACAGLAFELLVQEKLELGFALNIGFVEIEVAKVGEFVEFVRGADIAKQVGGHGSVNIPANRLHAHIHAGEAEVFLGENRHLFEIQILAVVVRHLAIRAVVDLQGVGIVVPRHSELFHAWNDGLGDDFYDIRLLEISRHVVHAATVGRDGHAALAFAVGAHHVGQVEIHFEAGAVFDELDAIPVEDFATDGGQADGHLRVGIDLRSVFRAAHDLDIPQAKQNEREAQKDEQPEKNNA